MMKLIALRARQAVGAAAIVTIGLLHPLADRLGRRLELAQQLVGRAPGAHQLHHLTPELRRVRGTTLRHANTSCSSLEMRSSGSVPGKLTSCPGRPDGKDDRDEALRRVGRLAVDHDSLCS